MKNPAASESVRKATPLVVISGLTGLVFAIIANRWPIEIINLDPVTAGFIQLPINAFVFYSNLQLLKAKGGWFARTFAVCGISIPIVMASITLVRVLVPWMVSLVS